jgi:membrane protease YdiL (CAAX protease family)
MEHRPDPRPAAVERLSPTDDRAGRGAGPALALVAAVAGYHVVDHRRIPERWHPAAHAVAAGVVAGAGRRLGLSWSAMGLAAADGPAGLRAGAAHAVIPVAGLLGASALPGIADALVDPRAADLPPGELARRTLVDIPVGTAVYEEVVFRGVLLGLLRDCTTDAVAVATTSALFGLWHVLPALTDRQHNPVAAERHVAITVGATVAATALAGAWLAQLRLRSGSLVAPIIAHAATNVAGLWAATIAHRRQRASSPSSPSSPVPAPPTAVSPDPRD